MNKFARRAAASVACAVTLAWASSCATATPIMKSGERVDVSATELRHRIDDAVPRFVGAVEGAADRIRRESDDPVVRKRALEWKVEAVQAVQVAAFQTDLAAAALDVWLLAAQMNDAFTTGAASTWFGAQQPIARETSADLLAMIEGYAARIAQNDDAFRRARAVIHETADRHPVDARIAARTSIVTIITTVEGRSAIGSMASVRSVADSLEEISNHLNSYMATLPKMGRWQAELMAADLAESYDLAGALAEFRRAALAAEQSDALATDAIEQTVGGIHGVLEAERTAMLREIDRQRIASLETLGGERAELLQALAMERHAAFEALHRERVETLQSAEVMRRELIKDASGHLVKAIDHLVLRLAQLFAAAGVCIALVIVLVRRIAPRRPGRD